MAMRLQVSSITTGELLSICINGAFWQARGWDSVCGSVSHQLQTGLFLNFDCQAASASEYAEKALTVFVLRRKISHPSDFDLRQTSEASGQSNSLEMWIVFSRTVHMKVVLAEQNEPPVVGYKRTCRRSLH